MIYTKERTYKMAYTELYEVLKRLDDEQKDKLPENFINIIEDEMDTDYTFTYDESIRLSEQNFMVETKALIVELYERYLCPEEEKEMWKKYDKGCLDEIEQKKAEKYSTDNLFKDKKQQVTEEIYPNENLPVEIKKEGIWQRIIGLIKRMIFINK